MQAKEFVKIKPSSGLVKGRFQVFEFEEGDHKIIYAPSLEISAYGSTENEAKDMFKSSVATFFEDYLTEHGIDHLYAELNRLGWKQDKYLKKKLSNLSKTTFEDIRKEFDLPEDAKYQKLEMAV